MKLIMKR